ncbi:hypothetical protein MVEN_00832600 [Mycena venus]|uniref:CFEM domain-containing protein n=1 Tax=Mycena venus TaxID=2733690 RepID=A0A8H7D0W1_9AGAR|nr:hypothetical protein MVEN_00832600 [Mycena venus]
MQLHLFITVAAGLFLISATAQNSTGATDQQQQCLIDCSSNAFNATGCVINDTPCICASPTYFNSTVQCLQGTCGFSASDVQSIMSGYTDDCANATSSAAGHSASSTPSGSGSSKPPGSSTPSGSAPASSQSGGAPQSSAQAIGARTGLAAASVVGLVFYALLM